VLNFFCCDINKNDDDRIKVVILMIVSCLIIPSGDGQNFKTTYVQFIEKLDEVDSYAWGATILSHLYQGLKENNLRNKKVDGFVWLIMVSAYCSTSNLHPTIEYIHFILGHSINNVHCITLHCPFAQVQAQLMN
jgi:hypothetical protein